MVRKAKQAEQKTLETVSVNLPKLQDYVLRGDRSSGQQDKFTPFFLKIQPGVKPAFYLSRKGGEIINLGETISAFPLFMNNDPMKRKTPACRCSIYDLVTNKGRTVCSSPDRWAGYTIKNGLARSCAKCPERNATNMKKVEYRTMFLLVLDPDDDTKVYLVQHEAKKITRKNAEKSTPEKAVYDVISDSLAKVYNRIQNEVWFGEDAQKTLKATGIPQLLLSFTAMKENKSAIIDPEQIFVVGGIAEGQVEEILSLKKEIEDYVLNTENSYLQRAKKLWDEGKQDVYARPEKAEEKSNPKTAGSSNLQKKSGEDKSATGSAETGAVVEAGSESEKDDDLPF